MANFSSSVPVIPTRSEGSQGSSVLHPPYPRMNTSLPHCPNGSSPESEEEMGLLPAHSLQHQDTNVKGLLRKRYMWGHWKQWKMYYYTIHNGSLVEFKSKKDLRPLKAISLRDCSIARADSIVNKSFVLSIAMPGRDTFFLQAVSEESLNTWLEAMQQYSRMVTADVDVHAWKSPTVVADHSGCITEFNAAAIRFFGFSREEAVREKVTILMPKSVEQYHAMYMKKYLRGGDRKLIGKPRRMQALHKDGYQIPVTLTMGEYVEKGKRFFVASFRDEREVNDVDVDLMVESAKNRINSAMEKELVSIAEKYQTSELGRRQSDAMNEQLRLRVKELEKELEEEGARSRELETQLLQQLQASPKNECFPLQGRSKKSREGRGANKERRGVSKERSGVSKERRAVSEERRGVNKERRTSSRERRGSKDDKSGLEEGVCDESGNSSDMDEKSDPTLSSSFASRQSSSPSSALRFNLQKRIGPYDFTDIFVSEKIADGRGIGADVYDCTIDGWSCVMKEFLVTEKSKESRRFNMFLKEIETLETLPPHPNICRYLFHSFDGKRLRLFTTKYSATLRWKIQEAKDCNDIMKPETIARVLLEILKGLQFLHDLDIAHRDLKSDNIFCMLSEQNEVRKVAIGDFDTAREVTEADRGKTCIGTPGYTAPEVLKAESGVEHDKKVDIWSFGMLVYEMTALQRPYHDAESIQSINQAILAGHIPQLPTLDLQFMPLVDIFKSCVVVDPSLRPSLKTLKRGLLKAFW